jgi:hypothetical protein
VCTSVLRKVSVSVVLLQRVVCLYSTVVELCVCVCACSTNTDILW